MNTKLSICIPTFNRSSLLLQTLKSVLPQLKEHNIPVFVRDNASGDNTIEMLESFKRNTYPHLFFKSNAENLGADKNFQLVVQDSTTEYCWLFGDDDVPCEGAVTAILAAIAKGAKFIILNSSVYKYDMTTIVDPNKLNMTEDRWYEPGEHSRLLADAAQNAGTISCMIVNRSLWLSAADQYYPETYPHVGAAFVSVLGHKAAVIARPLVKLGIGDRPSSPVWKFTTLMECWPKTIWGLPDNYDENAKRSVTIRDRRSSLSCVIAARALGMFDKNIYNQFYRTDLALGKCRAKILYLVACVPKPLCNVVSIVYLYIARPKGYKLLVRDILETSI